MLTCHPRIIVPPESGFALGLLPRFGDWRGEDCAGPRLEAFFDALYSARKFDTWRLHRPFLRTGIRSLAPESYADLVTAVYRTYGSTRTADVGLLGDKNNFHIQHVATLATLFPSCRFVHIIRDGRDVACSYRQLATTTFTTPYAPHLPTDITAIAHEWSTNVLAPYDVLGGQSPRLHTLRFEDLVRAPVATLTRLCEFLRLPFSAEMLTFNTRNTEESLEPAETMLWKLKTQEPVDLSTVGRFRSHLTANEIAAFEAEARNALETFGYLA